MSAVLLMICYVFGAVVMGHETFKCSDGDGGFRMVARTLFWPVTIEVMVIEHRETVCDVWKGPPIA